jgi:hypothetical protein
VFVVFWKFEAAHAIKSVPLDYAHAQDEDSNKIRPLINPILQKQLLTG